MQLKTLVLLLMCLFLFSDCQPGLQKGFLSFEDVTFVAEEYSSNRIDNKKGCNDVYSYLPDTNHLEHSPMRHIRVNVHFMNHSDSTQNFLEPQAIKFAQTLLKTAGEDLLKLKKPWIPPNNDLPALPRQYRYVLTPSPHIPGDIGIYCHYDDELYYFVSKGRDRNNYQMDVIKKYVIQEDSVLNIFIMPHHPDSVRSKTYTASGGGIALQNNIKLAGLYESGNHKPWAFRGVLNHEIGHVLGLGHAWRYDGCDDTPDHSNCWNKSDKPPCDTMASNNMMDYNAHQIALTPCQIGKIHKNLSRRSSRQRKMLIPVWCELKEDKTIYIKDKIDWKGERDLEGHIVIEAGGVLQIRCRLSLPKGAKIIVRPEGKLILSDAWIHNDCGDQWEGIEVQKKGKLKGEVIFTGKPLLENVRFLNPNLLNDSIPPPEQ